MAKIIRLTPDVLAEVKRDFERELAAAKLSDGKFSFSKSFGSISRKATVNFTEKAWLKMQTLIREFDKEVAWHGVAYRDDDPEKDEYYITDILVYPQEVTGATVTADQVKYQTWLMSHEDDVFNNIRMQGHSHVNMSTNPSSVDTELYRKILEQLDETMFYIFLIYNKRGEKTYLIYDMAKNILFETADVTVNIIDDGTGMSAFLADAKTKVVNRTYQYQGGSGYNGSGENGYPSYGGYGYGSGYNRSGYLGQNSKPSSESSVTKPKEDSKALPPAASEPDIKKNGVSSVSSKSGTKSSGRKKGRRRGRKNKQKEIVGQSRYPGFDYDDDDPYGDFD